MKFRLGKTRAENSLHPLTEREIQRRLYGNYSPLTPSPKETPTKETRGTVLLEEPRVQRPGASVKSYGKETLFLIGKATRVLLLIVGKVFRKLFTGWGIGIAVIVLLFIAIHSLNAYRTAGMKWAVKTPLRREPPKVETLKASPPQEDVLKPPTPSPEPPREEEIPPFPPRPYVIQVCIYARETDAERLAEQMKEARFPAFVQPLKRPNGKTFYPVFLGRYGTFQEAQARLKEFRGQPISNEFSDSFIRTLS